jgi:hypothetical protein
MEAVRHVGTKLYSNQRGYPRERVDFDWCKVLEVAPGGSEAAGALQGIVRPGSGSP